MGPLAPTIGPTKLNVDASYILSLGPTGPLARGPVGGLLGL